MGKIKGGKINILILTVIMILTQSAFVFGENSQPVQEEKNTAVSADGIETAEEMLEDRDYKADELIVSFDEDTSNRAIKDAVEDEDAECQTISTAPTDEKIVKVKIGENDTMEEAIVNLQSQKKVVSVQPNYRYTRASADPFLSSSTLSKSQYYFKNTKGLSLYIKEAWNLIYGLQEHGTTKVAVIDTGVDLAHKDLRANLTDTYSYPQFYRGKRNTLSEDTDSAGHGTHVTGIIGATYGNGIGGAGIASGTKNDLSKVMPVGASPDGYSFYTYDIVDALHYAVSNGAKVINTSFTGLGRDRVMEGALDETLKAGVTIVAAAGNESSSVYAVPSDVKGVISVTAVNSLGSFCEWSNSGWAKDIAAPGKGILSTIPEDRYAACDGTSMAAPIVTGIVALMLDANPKLTPMQVQNILCASVSPASNNYPGRYFGYGTVNAKKAVQYAIDAKENPTSAVTSISVKPGDVSIYRGNDFNADVLLYPANTAAKVYYSSSDTSVASVDPETGKITGVSPGKAVITASAGGKTAKCTVTVKSAVMATSISIENKAKYRVMRLNASGTLFAYIYPYTTTNGEVYWSTSNRNVVHINEYGIIRAVGKGSATVSVSTFDGKVKDSFTIQVGNVADRIALTSTVNWMKKSAYTKFAAKIWNSKGEKGFVNYIFWSSSNPKVAVVDKNGNIKPISPGVVTIWANASDGKGGYIKAGKKLIVSRDTYSGAAYGLKVFSNNYNSIKLSWVSIPIAAGYIVQRRAENESAYRTIKILKKGTYTSYINSSLTCGKKYYYRIRAYYVTKGKKGYFSNSSIVGAHSVLRQATLKTSYIKKGVALSWKNVSGASGYRIYRRDSRGHYVLYKIIRSSKVLTYKNMSLQVGKFYRYRVRAYRYVNGKIVFGAYSASKGRVVK